VPVVERVNVAGDKVDLRGDAVRRHDVRGEHLAPFEPAGPQQLVGHRCRCGSLTRLVAGK
jgi:hypothetical protein